MELGYYSFVETMPDPQTGSVVDTGLRLRQFLEEAELADAVGLSVLGLGEHHRADYAVSAPAVVLAAAAERTRSIRLSSAVTVLSSDDPVRVFQQFATLDQLSGGRAEIMAGRGSFIESFPLFGYDLSDYDELFDEKLRLLVRLRDEERLTWSGRHRPALTDQPVFPRPAQARLPIWVAVGGSPQSVMRTGTLGLPMALAIIGGEPARFKPFADHYREAGRRAGHAPESLKLGLNSHVFVADSSQEAAEIFYPAYANAMNRIGRERGWPPLDRRSFEASRGPRGALMVGSPDEVAAKIVAQHRIFRHDRFLAQMSVGAVPHERLLRSIELFGTKVAPRVAAALATAPAAAESDDLQALRT